MIYTVNSESVPSLHYSSEDSGGFGVPKFVWSNGRITSIGSLVDEDGSYGLGAYSYAIVADPEELSEIKLVF